jgi:hypothetical protein
MCVEIWTISTGLSSREKAVIVLNQLEQNPLQGSLNETEAIQI